MIFLYAQSSNGGDVASNGLVLVKGLAAGRTNGKMLPEPFLFVLRQIANGRTGAEF